MKKKYPHSKARDAARQQRLVSELGMLPATAMSKLRKVVFFNQLKKHNENVCVRCGQEIVSPNELSIEHIKPWEGISVELFWDLNNVAFSHLKCNVPHNRWGGRNKRKVGPVGTAWCIGHQQFLPDFQFAKSSWNWSGFQKYCKGCLVLRKSGKFKGLQEIRKFQSAKSVSGSTGDSYSLSEGSSPS